MVTPDPHRARVVIDRAHGRSDSQVRPRARRLRAQGARSLHTGGDGLPSPTACRGECTSRRAACEVAEAHAAGSLAAPPLAPEPPRRKPDASLAGFGTLRTVAMQARGHADRPFALNLAILHPSAPRPASPCARALQRCPKPTR